LIDRQYDFSASAEQAEPLELGYVAKVSLWVPRFPKQVFNPDKRLNFQADEPYQDF
jgi:hypothetical protein